MVMCMPITEDVIIIKCLKFDEKIAMLQRNISNSLSENIKLELYKDQKDYYIDIDDEVIAENRKKRGPKTPLIGNLFPK